MWPHDIEIGRVWMLFVRRRDARWNGRPIQSQSGDMGCFDPTPEPKPLHPIFELGMIAGHGEKEGQKTDECRVPKLEPSLLETHYGQHGADDKDGQTPARKSSAGLRGARQ